VHIACSKEQQQQQQQQPAAAAAASSSSSGGPTAQLLQQWRDANALPQANPSWTAAAINGGSSSSSSSGDRLNPKPGAAGGLLPPGDPSSWIVLGIESSCDDTAAAVIRGDGTVLSHKIASQVWLTCSAKFAVKVIAVPFRLNHLVTHAYTPPPIFIDGPA
jgi:hypothetical protein